MAWTLFLFLLLTQNPQTAFDRGVIAGVVQQEDGKPATHVRVAAMPVGENLANAAGNTGVLVALGETDELGRYRLENVPPGRYFVVAGRVNAPTFYPGVAQMSEAKAISVSNDSIVADINFTILKISTQPEPSPGNGLSVSQIIQMTGAAPPPSVIQLKGRIVLADGSKAEKLPEWLTIKVQTANKARATLNSFSVYTPDPSRITAGAPVASDGTFGFSASEGSGKISVTGLPPGYALQMITADGRDLLKTNLDVAQQGTPEIVIVVSADLRPRYRIEGRIQALSGKDAFGEMIELISESGTTVRVIVGSRDLFAFSNVLPGKYTLRISSPAIGNVQQSITVVDGDVNVELRP